MKEQAKVIIIGGGITARRSLATAKRGWTDVLLLEKGELTSGTTFHWSASSASSAPRPR